MKKEEVFDAHALPKLRKLSGGFFMRRIFQKAGPQDRVAYGLSMNFIRLVDQAIRSYEAGRAAMEDFANTHEHLAWGSLETACGQFELCVQSIYRAEAMATGVIKYKDSPPSLIKCYSSSKNVLSNRLSKDISKMRNTIHHLDKELRGGNIDDGQAVSLVPGCHALELGKVSVKYDILVEAITTLYPISEAVSRYREN